MTACVKLTSDSNIKVEENGRKAVFRNPERVEYKVCQIDGCLITGDDIRADYMVTRVSDNSVVVELKGADVAHACEQVFNAVRHPAVKPHLGERVGFLVICSRFPRFDTSVRKAKDRAAREFKGGFHVVCGHGQFDIERVVAINGPR